MPSIGIIDADLIGRKNHRFPNLACMKISSYYKEKGYDVTLLNSYLDIMWFDEVFISKVFTDTPVPDWIELNAHLLDFDYFSTKVHVGGTGFFFDKAPALPPEIEHHMPDYHLYDKFVETINDPSATKGFTDYSIGFMTRGCFRKCKFCVNQKYDKVFLHSPLEEFYDPTRKKICLLDDNVLGCAHWREILETLIATGKPFKFKQGLDERLLTDEKCEILFNAKYDSSFTFAFDDIDDYDLIESKLKMIRRHTKKPVMFYVLVGFKSTDINDIRDAFRRIELLFKYGSFPYIMRYMDKNYAPYKDSEFRAIYVNLARWCNQPSICKKKTFREYCRDTDSHGDENAYSYRELLKFEKKYPEIANQYFDIRYTKPYIMN